MIWYSFERSFVTAAIEVSTIMLLEVSYGWPSERCGLVFTVVSSTSLLLTWLSSMVMSRNSVPESTVGSPGHPTVACLEAERTCYIRYDSMVKSKTTQLLQLNAHWLVRFG